MTPTERGSPWRLLATAAGLVAAVTAAVALVPPLPYAVRAPGLHIALNTADGAIALLVAYLVYGRFARTRRLRDLLLAGAMVALAFANVPLAALPGALGDEDLSAPWSPLLVRTWGAALLALAALTAPTRRLERRAARRRVLLLAVVTAALAVGGRLLDPVLGAAVPAVDAVDPGQPLVVGHPLVLSAQVLGVLLYGCGAVAFTLAATRERDEFLRWLGAAALLGAGARVNYLLFPSLYTDLLYTGDVLRLGFYLLLLVGAGREIRSYWSDRLTTAEARGRRDAFRDAQAVVLPRVLDLALLSPPEQRRSAQAVVAEVREALTGLQRDAEAGLADGALAAALRDALGPVAAGLGMTLHVRAEPGTGEGSRQAAVLEIAREAVQHAGRFSGAWQVTVEVGGRPLRLVVADNGAGDPAAERTGLRRARALAEAGGAVLSTSSSARGSTVTVTWPEERD